MNQRRVIDSRNTPLPAVLPAAHPACQRPHFHSQAQLELMERAIRLQIERDYWRARADHNPTECDDDHCPFLWLATQEAAIRYQAESRVLGMWHALAARCLRNPRDVDAHTNYDTAVRGGLEPAVTAEQDQLRADMARRTQARTT